MSAIWIFVVVFGAVWSFHRVQVRRKRAWEQWVAAHENALRRGETLIWRGRPVNAETRLIQFLYGISFVILCAKFPTAYAFPGSWTARLQNLIASLITCVFGWWGIPWGPVYTLECLHLNLREGGHFCQIADLFPEPEGALS